MCKQLSTEYILGSILTLKSSGISISELSKLENKIYKKDSELILDLSRASITSVLETYNQYFKCENDILRLTDTYTSNISKIKLMFYDVLDRETKKVLLQAFL